MSVSLLVFSHSSANDYLHATLDRIEKYFPFISRYYAIDDKNSYTLNYKFTKIIEYDTTWSWSKKMCHVLSQIPDKYVFLLISNNIFIGKFPIETLEKYISCMEVNQIDQLRMNNSPILNEYLEFLQLNQNTMNIYKIAYTDFVFSVQPAIWKKNTLVDILEKHMNVDYRDIELSCSPYTKKFNNYFVYTSKDFTNYSHECPFIHALTFGKWIKDSPFFEINIRELAKEYSIDISKRGWNC